MAYTRYLKPPDKTFFLFGARGTGKTTWLRQQLPNAHWFDLLHNDVYVQLLRNPSHMRMVLSPINTPSWIVIDEVQKLPALLDEVHALLSTHHGRLKFALSGSSARKLKRLNANLLAGRALTRQFFPLTGAELDYQVPDDLLLRVGCLPEVHQDPRYAVDILEAYVATYLKEEIQQEAMVQNLGSFSRFLEVAALMNGQIVNVSSIARDAGVARPTVQRYFETLIDTLIGFWLRPWQPKLKVREVTHPKFYFFDAGVVRTLTNHIRQPLSNEEKGSLFETLVLHELRAWINISNAGGQLYYWRTPAGVEVDFIWQRGQSALGFEAKSTRQWKSEYSKALKELIALGSIKQGYGVYLGDDVLQDGPVTILPFKQFQRQLAAFQP